MLIVKVELMNDIQEEFNRQPFFLIDLSLWGKGISFIRQKKYIFNRVNFLTSTWYVVQYNQIG